METNRWTNIKNNCGLKKKLKLTNIILADKLKSKYYLKEENRPLHIRVYILLGEHRKSDTKEYITKFESTTRLIWTHRYCLLGEYRKINIRIH